LYTTGAFVLDCCPAYMRPENYTALQQHVDRIIILQGNFLEALRQISKITYLYPLDHMDCLSEQDVHNEAIEMKRVTSHLSAGSPVAVVKCVSRSPKYISILRMYFEVKDVTDDLKFDGSDLYMVQRAFLLTT